MKTSGMTACAALLTAAAAYAVHQAADEEKYKSAKVGDWISEKKAGLGKDREIKRTVVAKDARHVTVKEETTVDGETSVDETKYRLDKTFELPYASGAKVEAVAEGEETLRVGEKDYACKWTQVKVTWELDGQARTSESKTWRCKDVPFGGVVKSEVKGALATVVTEMTGCGRGK